MQFDIKDGKPGSDRWKWETYRNDAGEELRAHLYIPDSAKWARYLARFKVGTPKYDPAGAIKYIGQQWFDQFEGAKDADGNDIENSPAMRALMLHQDKAFFVWVQNRSGEFQEEEEEGNEDSGTD